MTDDQRRLDAFETERALDHIAGKGRPADTEAPATYSATWTDHLRDRLNDSEGAT